MLKVNDVIIFEDNNEMAVVIDPELFLETNDRPYRIEYNLDEQNPN